MTLLRRGIVGRILRAPLLWLQHFAILRRANARGPSALAATRLTANLFR